MKEEKCKKGNTYSEDKAIMLKMDEKYLSTKKLDYRGYAATNFLGAIGKDKKRRINRKDFEKYLKINLNLSRYKIKNCIDTLISVGLLEEGKNGMLMMDSVTQPFLKLYAETVKYFFNHYQPIHFKVYCYLLNKYNINKAYQRTENYFFSTAELLRVCGYNDRKFENVKLMNEVLIDLENNHFIEYNHQGVGRSSYQGVYKELYFVNDIAENSVQAIEETKQELGPVVYDGSHWIPYEEAKKIFAALEKDSSIFKYPDNYKAIVFAIEHKDIPENKTYLCDKFFEQYNQSKSLYRGTHEQDYHL